MVNVLLVVGFLVSVVATLIGLISMFTRLLATREKENRRDLNMELWGIYIPEEKIDMDLEAFANAVLRQCNADQAGEFVEM